MFIHERDAFNDLTEILDKYTNNLPPVVIHCFTGSVENALAYLSKGFYIGLTGESCNINKLIQIIIITFQDTYVKINQIQAFESFS